MPSARIEVRQRFSFRPLSPYSGARADGDIPRRQKHGFATRAVSNEMNYIDKWFKSIVKPKCFYEKHADGAVRRYFYNIDLQGRLFLEDTLPKNIATSIKDDRFLNFFFSRVCLPRQSDIEFLASEGVADDYPYVSHCGREVNYIRPAATPIVFHALMDGWLIYGGNLRQTFRPCDLAVSLSTGRLYHRVESQQVAAACEYGLIRSSIAVGLSEQIQTCDDTTMQLNFTFAEESYPIKQLPASFESGLWGLCQVENLW